MTTKKLQIKKRAMIIFSSLVFSSTLLSGCGNTATSDFEYQFHEGQTTIIAYNGTDRNVKIPNSIENRYVTSIGDMAFGSEYGGSAIIKKEQVNNYKPASDIISISFPDNLLSIGEGAFKFCTSLEKVDLTNCNNFNYINNYAFSGCTELKTLSLSNSTQYILDYAFDGCTSLTEITIPQSVKGIFNYAFHGCSSLTDVYFESGESIENISDNVFENCSENLVIHAPKNSYIEMYANENNIIFQTL